MSDPIMACKAAGKRGVGPGVRRRCFLMYIEIANAGGAVRTSNQRPPADRAETPGYQTGTAIEELAQNGCGVKRTPQEIGSSLAVSRRASAPFGLKEPAHNATKRLCALSLPVATYPRAYWGVVSTCTQPRLFDTAVALPFEASCR